MGSPLLPGTRLGHYEIISPIGAGGMGEVYLAQDTKLDRKVAVKILPTDLASNEQHMRRFTQEAKAASALNHPGILTIYEIGQTNGQHFIVTEFVEGISLRERMFRRDALMLPEALDIAAQVSSALVAAHEKGIIHRDIKPENLMVRKDGLVKVIDFGLAKNKPFSSEIDSEAPTRMRMNTEPGLIIGTVAYMSPEQARGVNVDARTDIWSLGVVLFEMIVGRQPFAEKDVHRQIIAIQEQPTPSITRLAERAPERLEEIVSKTLAKNADERYQTAKDLLIDLKRVKRKLDGEAEIERDTPVGPGPSTKSMDLGDTMITPPGDEVGTNVVAIPTSSNTESIIKRPRSVAWIALAAAALAVAVGYFVYARWIRQSNTDKIRSVAVLPFVNTGDTPDTEYLSDGISESLINSLSQLPGMKVIARSSSFKYSSKDADLEQVANALGVEAILTGRVSQRGDELVISVELVNARDKTNVWGQQYRRKASDVLHLQSEISREIAEQLRVRLSSGAQQQFARVEAANPQAYGLLLKGRYASSKGGSENRKQALEYFRQAITVDPTYAPAYAEISASYTYLIGNGILDPKEFAPQAEVAVRKALELDEGLAEAHLALANIKLNAWDWANAEREYQRAIELNPNLAEAYRWYSVYLGDLGRHDEAIARNSRGRELDPLSLAVNADTAFSLLMARRYDQAVASLQKTLELDPKVVLAHIYLGYAYSAMGRYPEAIAEFQQGQQLGENSSSLKIYLGAAYTQAGERAKAQQLLKELQATKDYVSPGELAILYAALGEREQAFASLEKAFAAHDLQLQYLGVDASFDPLRGDPRFDDLLRRVGLPVKGS